MFTAHNITKKLDQKAILKGVSLQAEKGETLGLICTDEEERTCLMDILGGALIPDGGEVTIDNMTIEAETSLSRNMIGYIPAKPPILRDMTPRAAMKFQADARGLSVREASDAIDSTIKLLKLQDVCDKPAARLAPGAAHLVAIAQALFFGPKALIIDEPTKDMDAKEIIALRQAIREISRDRCVVLASGNITELCALCGRVAVIRGGKIVAEGAASDLQNMTAETDQILVTVGADEKALIEKLNSVPGVTLLKSKSIPDGSCAVASMEGDRRAAIAQAIVGAGLPLWGLSPVKKPLDDVIENLRSDRFNAASEDDEGKEGTGEEA